MKLVTHIVALLLLQALTISCVAGTTPSRSKRSLLSLLYLELAETNVSPLKFLTHGNWCGAGGSGEPIDETDVCCRNHDWCCEAVVKDCHSLTPFIVNYRFTRKPELECTNDPESCKFKACSCDVGFIKCIKNIISESK